MPMPCVGRRPFGLSSEPTASLCPLGDYYASIAHLEGAAVLAFDVMARELERFGAPHELQLRAQRARADEERHHRLMAAFARREGGAVPGVRAVEPVERSLLAAALENAVEGCVREAWGALSAHYQAAKAAEPEARQLWHDIAADESEHAELSLALHDWFMLQLAAEEQRLVEAAMHRARLELRAELASGPAPYAVVAQQAGVPEPAHATALFSELERQVLGSLMMCAA
jgi:rubrerythrin